MFEWNTKLDKEVTKGDHQNSTMYSMFFVIIIFFFQWKFPLIFYVNYDLCFVIQIRSDFESQEDIEYSLEGIGASREPYNVFVVDSKSGKIRVTRVLDREFISVYNVSDTWQILSNYNLLFDFGVTFPLLYFNNCFIFYLILRHLAAICYTAKAYDVDVPAETDNNNFWFSFFSFQVLLGNLLARK